MRSQHSYIPLPVLTPTNADELAAIGWFFQEAYVYHPKAVNDLAANRRIMERAAPSMKDQRCINCGHYWADHNPPPDDSCALCGCDWFKP